MSSSIDNTACSCSSPIVVILGEDNLLLTFTNIKAHVLIVNIVAVFQKKSHTLILAYQLNQVCFESQNLHLYHKHSHDFWFYMYMKSHQLMKFKYIFNKHEQLLKTIVLNSQHKLKSA